MWVCPKGRGMPRCHGPYFRFPGGDPEKPGEETLSTEQGPGTEGWAGARTSPGCLPRDQKAAAALVLHDGAFSTGRATSGGTPPHHSPLPLPSALVPSNVS